MSPVPSKVSSWISPHPIQVLLLGPATHTEVSVSCGVGASKGCHFSESQESVQDLTGLAEVNVNVLTEPSTNHKIRDNQMIISRRDEAF